MLHEGLTTGQAAKYISRHPKTLQAMDRAGVLPARRTARGRHYWLRPGLDRYLGRTAAARPRREDSDQPETKYRGLHGNQRLGTGRLWLGWHSKRNRPGRTRNFAVGEYSFSLTRKIAASTFFREGVNLSSRTPRLRSEQTSPGIAALR